MICQARHTGSHISEQRQYSLSEMFYMVGKMNTETKKYKFNLKSEEIHRMLKDKKECTLSDFWNVML